MTIRYSLKRKDIWDAYWFTWRNGWKLKATQFIFGGLVFVITTHLMTGGRTPTISQLAIACGVALLSILWLPVYPLLLYKSEERMLTIGPQGVVTSIGDLSGEVRWAAIARVQADGDRVYLIGKQGHAFTIPSTAFTSSEERGRFVDQCVLFWQNRQASSANA